MFAADVLKSFFRRSSSAVCYIVQALPNAFVGIGARRKIQKVLVGLGVLYDSSCFPFYR
jgi:hypothetical protein